MTYRQPARTPPRRLPRILVASLLVVISALGAALGYPLLASSSSTATSAFEALRSERRGVAPATGPDSSPAGGLQDRRLVEPGGPDRFGQRPGRPPGAAAPGQPVAAA